MTDSMGRRVDGINRETIVAKARGNTHTTHIVSQTGMGTDLAHCVARERSLYECYSKSGTEGGENMTMVGMRSRSRSSKQRLSAVNQTGETQRLPGFIKSGMREHMRTHRTRVPSRAEPNRPWFGITNAVVLYLSSRNN